MEVSDRPSDAQDKTAYCIFWFFKIGLLEQCIYKRDVDNFHAQIDLLQVEPCKSVALAWVTLGLLGLCFLQWKCSAVCGWSASSTSLVLLLAGNGHLHPCSFLCPYNITYSSSSMSVTSPPVLYFNLLLVLHASLLCGARRTSTRECWREDLLKETWRYRMDGIQIGICLCCRSTLTGVLQWIHIHNEDEVCCM